MSEIQKPAMTQAEFEAKTMRELYAMPGNWRYQVIISSEKRTHL
ncbi:hypothetical protein N752_30575 [Desulforamulus aquiferis]|nr:hypothetical protein N752_30575 [Desulforamulus aquiferis]